MRYLECLVDKGVFGKQATVMHKGQRFFHDDTSKDDAFAVDVWIKTGLVRDVDAAEKTALRARVMTTDNSDALIEPKEGGKRGRYARRDMRARD